MERIRIYRDKLGKVLDTLRKVAEKRRKSSSLHDPEQLVELEKAIDEQQSQIRAFSEDFKKTQRDYYEEKSRNIKLQEEKVAIFKVGNEHNFR